MVFSHVAPVGVAEGETQIPLPLPVAKKVLAQAKSPIDASLATSEKVVVSDPDPRTKLVVAVCVAAVMLPAELPCAPVPTPITPADKRDMFVSSDPDANVPALLKPMLLSLAKFRPGGELVPLKEFSVADAARP